MHEGYSGFLKHLGSFMRHFNLQDSHKSFMRSRFNYTLVSLIIIK